MKSWLAAWGPCSASNLSGLYRFCHFMRQWLSHKQWFMAHWLIENRNIVCYEMCDQTNLFLNLCVEFWGHMNIYLQFIEFLKSEVTLLIRMLLHGIERPIYWIQSISLLLVAWQCMEPGHLKPPGNIHYWLVLSHWGWDKMVAISQTTFSNAFSWLKMYWFQLKFHWRLSPMVQVTIFQHWVR